VVYINGHRANAVKGRDLKTIRVRHLPAGRTRIVIVARTTRGGWIRTTRSYTICPAHG
jgi:hypothetical protein